MTGCAKTMSDCPGRVEIWQIFSTCKTTGQRKSSILARGKSCVLPTREIDYIPMYPCDRWRSCWQMIGNYKTRRRNNGPKLSPFPLKVPSPRDFFTLSPNREPVQRLCQNNLSKPLLVPYEVTQNSFHRTQRMRITSSVTQDGACVLVVNYLSFYSC